MSNHHTDEALNSDIEKVLKDVLHRTMFAKSELCKQEAMTDSPPLFIVGYESDPTNPDHEACVEYQQEYDLSKPLHLAMVPLIHKDDVFECIEDVVRALPIERFETLMLVSESYMRVSSEDTEPFDMSNYQRGDMEKDYKENPFSNVREAIMVSAIDWHNSTLWGTVCAFTYDDNGVPSYMEPETHTISLADSEGESKGRIPDILTHTVRYMHLAMKADKYRDILGKAPKTER